MLSLPEPLDINHFELYWYGKIFIELNEYGAAFKKTIEQLFHRRNNE